MPLKSIYAFVIIIYIKCFVSICMSVGCDAIIMYMCIHMYEKGVISSLLLWPAPATNQFIWKLISYRIRSQVPTSVWPSLCFFSFFFSSSCLHLLLRSPSPSVPSLAVSSYTHSDSLLPLPRTSHTSTSLIPSSSCFRTTLILISSSSFTYFFFSALPFSFIFSSSFSSLIFPFPIPPACSLRPHPRRPPPGSRQKYFVMAWAGLGQAGEIVSPAAERMKTIKAEVRPAVPTWGGRQRWLITSSIANYLQRDLSTISAGDRNLHFVTRDWIVSYLVGQDSGWLGDGVGSNA